MLEAIEERRRKAREEKDGEGAGGRSAWPALFVLVADIMLDSLKRAYSIHRVVHMQLEIHATDRVYRRLR